MSSEEARLLKAFRRLDSRGRASLLDYVAFLVSRTPQSLAATPEPRPAAETVVQAIRRLSRSYPGLGRHALMPLAERLLAQHMVDGRPAAEVIDELEHHCAARCGGPAP